MVAKSDKRKQQKAKERKKRKELGRQKETLSYNFTKEHKKLGKRNTAILIGLSAAFAVFFIYFIGNL